MTLVTRQAMSDDSGVFTDGTAVNKAFIDQLYDQMDDQLHSSANPTVKPKATTDEVVTARGSKASLDARLDISLNEDGTLKTQASLVSAADYQAGLGGRNVAINGDLDDWSSGGAAAPDDWTLSAGTIARTGNGQADTFHFGTGENGYAAKVTRAGANITLKQVVIAGASFANLVNVKSQKFGVAMKGKTALANALRIVVDDGVSTTASSYHTGGNTEEHLSALHTISNTATKLEVYASFETSAGDSYVGGFIFVFANLAPTDWSPLSSTPVATATRKGLVSTGDQTVGGLKSFTKGSGSSGHVKFEPGTSSGTSAPASGVIYADTGPRAATAVATEQDLATFSLPANTLSANGKAVRVTAWGTCANSAGTKIIRLYFGATSIHTTVLTLAAATASQRWEVVAIIQRRDATNQRAYSRPFAEEAGVVTVNRHMQASPTETLANAITVKITCTNAGGAANDTIQEGYLIEVVG